MMAIVECWEGDERDDYWYCHPGQHTPTEFVTSMPAMDAHKTHGACVYRHRLEVLKDAAVSTLMT